MTAEAAAWSEEYRARFIRLKNDMAVRTRRPMNYIGPRDGTHVVCH
jgi:hypothetical protein